MTVTDTRTATAPAPRALPAPRRLARITPEDVVPLVSAALGAVGLVWIAYERLLPFSGTVGFWLLTYVVFLVLYRIVLGTLHDKVIVRDRLMAAIFASAGLVMAAALGSVLLFTLVRGWEAVSHANFFTETTAFIGPDAPLDSGGIYAAMVGTLQQIGLATLISVPLGLATAVYLNEVGGRMARTVRTVVEAMSAIPTIVAGLFVYSIAILTLGFERSGFAAALALTVGMLPVVTTTAEVVLRLVPNGLREASLALGTSKWRTVRGVVLPTARPGLVTAVLLGVARVVGETSPVLLVAGLTSELNYNAFSGPQLSLPLFVFNQVRYPLDTAISRAFGAAVVLLLVVVVLFALARIIGGRPVGAPSRRLWRRRPTGEDPA